MEIETPAQFIELQKECIAQVKFYVELANKKLGIAIPMPKVLFSLKGRTAGRAHTGDNLIEFSPTLLRENADDFLVKTTGHEVAHLIARIQHRGKQIKSHGKEWMRVMWAFSLPATRCHSYDTSNVPTQIGKQARNTIKRTVAPVRTESGLIVRPSAIGRLVEFD
jgi:predicted SprT family Zn-dependent metalloprotease